MGEHPVEPVVPFWRILLCMLFWCFFIVGAIFAVAGDLVLQTFGVTPYNASGVNGLYNAIYMLGIWPFTSAMVISGMRPIKSRWWKRALGRLSIIALITMGAVPNKVSLMKIGKWIQAADTTPSAWLIVIFLAAATLVGKCLILFYWWRVATSESAKILQKPDGNCLAINGRGCDDI